MANKKVADVIIESLIAAGVKRVYGISGDSLNGITDSIREHDKDISWVHVRQELLVPPSINLEQIKGFTLYMVKAILNGKGDEVVDLARTNLFM